MFLVLTALSLRVMVHVTLDLLFILLTPFGEEGLWILERQTAGAVLVIFSFSPMNVCSEQGLLDGLLCFVGELHQTRTCTDGHDDLMQFPPQASSLWWTLLSHPMTVSL